ncbi:MAG TPA: aspartate kinase, partial [Thermoanaerobaculia bacterium]|nr:aspartate kinase [Thermoanaerobaculia bacterium]
MSVDVFKFGGVAVGSAEAIQIAAAHVQRGISATNRVAAVVSAANGVTDMLLAAAQAALRNDRV